MQKYNHKRTLESFQEEIDIIKTAGFNPIGVSQLICETTFIFETEAEALEAYEVLEKTNHSIMAWWYSKEQFLFYIEEYGADFGTKVLVYWL